MECVRAFDMEQVWEFFVEYLGHASSEHTAAEPVLNLSGIFPST